MKLGRFELETALRLRSVLIDFVLTNLRGTIAAFLVGDRIVILLHDRPRMLTVIMSLRLQGRAVLPILTQVLRSESVSLFPVP